MNRFSYKALVYSVLLHLFMVLIAWAGIRTIPFGNNEVHPFEVEAAHSVTPQILSRRATKVDQTTANRSLMIHSGVSGEERKSSATSADSYLALIRQKILEHQTYPRLARKQGLEDTVTVEVEIDGSGQVTQIKAISRANYTFFEEAARESILKASPFPPPPPGFTRKFAIPVEFRLIQ